MYFPFHTDTIILAFSTQLNCHKKSMIQMDIFFKVRILTLIHLLISGDPRVDYIPFPQ